MVKILVDVPSPRALRLSWLDDDKQKVLREVFSTGVLSRDYVSRFAKTTWDQLIGERHFGEKMEYEVPRILIDVGMQLPYPDMVRPGHYHLGVLYPLDELDIMHRILSTTAPENHRLQRNSRWESQKERMNPPAGAVRPKQLRNLLLRKFTRIYPQPRSPDRDNDDSWKVFPHILIGDFGGIILRVTTNLVTQNYLQLRNMPYRQIITAWGGPTKVAERLCGYIDRDVLSLEGKSLSVEFHQAAKKRLSSDIEEVTGESVHEGFPVGDIAARIGIVLTRCVISLEEESVPWGIRETGFTEKNCLIWLADPRCRQLTQKSQALGRRALEKAIPFHRTIIENSYMRVIMLDFESSQYVVPGIPPHLRQDFQLELYCGTISGFIETDNQSGIKRVYLHSRRSLTSLLSCPGPATQLISEMFKLAAALTCTYGIRPYYCASSSAVHQILKIYGEEQDGATQMTATNTPVMIQAFLYRKGFRQAEDIQRLIDVGGYLSRSLLLLLVVLRRQPSQFGGSRALRAAGSKRKPHRRGIFSSTEMQKLSSLLSVGLVLPPAEEGTGLSGKSPAHIAVECLAPFDGRVDSQELGNTIQLADEKEEELRAMSKENENYEQLDLEANDIGVDTLCSELFPEGSEDTSDVDPGLDLAAFRPSKSSGPTAKRRSPAWYRTRVLDKSILDRGVRYRGYWQPEQGRLLIHVRPDLAHILITLKGKRHREEFAPEILVKAEIHPSKRHPNCWARDARDSDPGAKLAFVVDYGEGERYSNEGGETTARKANTFVDWFFGCSLETIANRPRRHICTGKGDTVVRALGLSGGGTYYTDDDGELIKN
ncbi:hypothetical protein BJX64DRAFT_291534 [Aspergillus heterothallicus]